jgi:hypothetical protein
MFRCVEKVDVGRPIYNLAALEAETILFFESRATALEVYLVLRDK